MNSSLLQTMVDVEFLEKVLEITQHSAWQGAMDEKTADILLRHQKPMTYLIRQDLQSEYDYWLSHKKTTGELHHRHFSVRLFPDGWFFTNHIAPPNEDLGRFIQGALACKD